MLYLLGMVWNAAAPCKPGGVMALSNWATLAFDDNGDPCDGYMHGLRVTDIEIYKSWAYIHSDEMWVDGGAFDSNVIAQIHDGHMTIGDLEIEAVRGPQNAIFVMAESTFYPEKGETQRKRMAGIGCCGYTSEAEAMAEHFNLDLSQYEYCNVASYFPADGGEYKILECWYEDHTKDEFVLTFDEMEELGLMSKWIGVLPSTFEAFINWLGGLRDAFPKDYQTWVEKIRTARHKQFNQGDAFFVGADEAMHEQAKTPIFEKMMQADEEASRRRKEERK